MRTGMETDVDSESRFTVTPRMVLGITFALAGVMLTADRLGLAPIGRLFRYWPVPIMVIGGLMFAQARDSRERFRGAVFAGVGTWLFLNAQGLLRVSLWDLFWPVLLIVFGTRLILVPGGGGPRHRFRRGRHGERFQAEAFDAPSGAASFEAEPERRDDEAAGTRWRRGFSADPSERVSIFSLMSHVRRASTAPRFRGGDVTAFMGGGELDLRLATIAPGEEAVLDIVAVMGGVDLYAPPHWEISTPIMSIMGGVEDKRLPPLPGDSARGVAAPRLVLRGFVMMGSVEIK